MSKLTIGRITFKVIKESDIADFPGRKMIHLRRDGDRKTYVVTRYENGSYSSVQFL
jgi:hypothetical protein